MDKKRVVAILLFTILFLLAIIISLIYYNGKYSVSFETGTKDVFLTQYVKKNGKAKEPANPSKSGYVFIEWQLDGKKYDFNNRVNKNIVLTAKWAKEEYVTISFDTGTTESIDSIKILKGEALSNVVKPHKDNYEFVGWKYNEKLYSGEEIYDDITLVAVYEKIKKDFNIGNKVKIIGNYSSSAYNLNAEFNAGIGWEREILYVVEDSEFPYAVGNSYGVTGFFSENSIELIEGEI